MGIPSMRIVVVALTLLGTSVTPLSAAELRVYSGGAPQETLKLLAPEFEKATGHLGGWSGPSDIVRLPR